MSDIQPFCSWVGINPAQLSRKELFIIEAEIIAAIYEGLKNYFSKFSKEEIMFDDHGARLIIHDLVW